MNTAAAGELRSLRDTATLDRRRWHITGRVQGVGFRPFVYRAAVEAGITGAVWNDGAGVVVEGQGPATWLDAFARRVRADAPRAARVRAVTCDAGLPVVAAEREFHIRRSRVDSAPPNAEVAVDTAVCPACLADLRNPHGRRRHGYALVNCTDCGPRYSIVRRVPYDRASTTMAAFRMCRDCRAEYDDPADRRFHAQPNACHACGPAVELVDAAGAVLAGPQDAIREAARRLCAGGIVAVKGVGGYHLAARADSVAAVDGLRRLKHRPAKPFALMCASAAAAWRLVRLNPDGCTLLGSPAAPIVLAPRRAGAAVADGVAPGQPRLGVMLAYSPLHHLLFDQCAAIGTVDALVMTSGNDAGEPLVCDDAEALARLGNMCGALLRHGRPIARPVDDSVVIAPADLGGCPMLVRRSRGYAPAPLGLPVAAESAPGVCLGAELKGTVAVVRGAEAILSQHLGDVTQGRTYALLRATCDDLCALFDVAPRWVAHDRHPGYLSTALAKELAARWRVPRVAVQHHHAHAAAVLAEHGNAGPALAVVCDGTGFGSDGAIWGGELLVAGLTDFRRVGRLRPIRLPGGDAAAREPWRVGLALLHALFGDGLGDVPPARRLGPEADRAFVWQMLRTGTNCPPTSSAGRYFDAVAALLGLCGQNRFEGEAAMTLESAAAAAATVDDAVDVPDNTFDLRDRGGLTEIDLFPWLRELTRQCWQAAPGEQAVARLAATFHEVLEASWEAAVVSAAARTGLDCVALSGGAMCNERLVRSLYSRLGRRGLRVLTHREVPPNDGGVAYGQAAVAAARAAAGRVEGCG
jgi:hydrogenase maturation protein HypF